jgi:hypothetical protein
MQGSGTRPLGVGDVLDVAMKVYRHNARLLFQISGAAYVPALLVFVVALDIVSSSQPLGDWSAGERTMRIVIVSLLVVVSVVASLCAVAACTRALSEIYLGHAPAPRAMLGHALRRLPALIGAGVLVAFGTLIGFIALAIPGIWLLGAWIMTTPAVVIDGLGPFAAPNRSRNLVSGRWWPVVGATFVGAFAVGIVNELLNALVRAPFVHDSHISRTGLLVVYFVSASVAGVFLQPFSAAVSTVLYYDLRFRKEGYDPWLEYDGPVESHVTGEFGGELPAGRSDARPERTFGPQDVGTPGGPPFWPPPPGWRPGT